MAQHDYVIANGTGAAVRSDLNNGLAAIVSNNSGATEPATMYAYQWWPDTTTGLLKQRNAANSAWVTIGTLASANLGLLPLAGGTMTGVLAVTAGTAALPGIAVSGDLNTGLVSPGADQLAITTGGTSRLAVSTTAVSSTLAVDVPLGAVGTPSLTFTGDLNTGLFSPGADTVALVTGGTNRVHVTSGGLVGLGTSAPASTLHVAGTFRTTGQTVLGIGETTTLAYIGDAFTTNTRSIFFNRPSGSLTGIVNIQGLNAGVDLTDISLQAQGGRVGIGTNSPSAKLEVSSSSGTESRITSTADSNADLTFYTNSVQRGIVEGNSLGMLFGTTGALPTTFITNNAERARLDSSGRLLVGSSTSAPDGSAQIQLVNSAPILQVHRNSNDAYEAILTLSKARGSSNQIVQNGDTIGNIIFQAADGSNAYLNNAASIKAQVDGTPGANDMPGRLVFSTTADGASSPTERMRITQAGDVLVAKTTVNDLSVVGIQLGAGTFKGTGFFTTGDESGILINRQNSDGSLLNFYQASVLEGSISVSGTTVSYNGAHLSRWSQLPADTVREEILRGTVLSNIDEMCGWGEEENEQLNRMKVSDVEGDKNVSGVFQAWDDDDDTYTDDFYCAMTGDFVIRIAEGVTVERGDLLMSAGDGTAKPQDDDIIRSKTIAKVTSTHVTCTYEDGSYCVPCVLMAC